VISVLFHEENFDTHPHFTLSVIRTIIQFAHLHQHNASWQSKIMTNNDYSLLIGDEQRQDQRQCSACIDKGHPMINKFKLLHEHCFTYQQEQPTSHRERLIGLRSLGTILWCWNLELSVATTSRTISLNDYILNESGHKQIMWRYFSQGNITITN
jgi:hypothetical protein